MHSAMFRGWIGHHRRYPKRHRFRYPITLFYLDLAEVPEIGDAAGIGVENRWRPLQFRRSDYLGPTHLPLDTAVRDLVELRLGIRPSGPVRLLTNLRYFGFCFNPVSFYYCFDLGSRLQSIVAEVNNTPWGERHSYVLRVNEAHRQLHFQLRKDFHVSPFMPMDIDYRWRFSQPAENLSVCMANFRGGKKLFSANLHLKRQPLTAKNLRPLLWQFPWQTHRILTAIYWQAFKLFLKRTPFFDHPKHQRTMEEEST